MSLLQRLGKQPLLPLCSLVAVLLGLLGAVLYWHHSQRNQEIQLSLSGQALAASGARQAVNATLNQDMISLQVVLQELRRHPSVVGATIHDVENRLLVQSGKSPSEPVSDYLSHSAPITLHNNIAGHLRLTMDAPRASATDKQFFWIWSLSVLVAMALPWLPGALQSRFQASASQGGNDLSAEEEPIGEPVTLRLHVELLNLPLLYRQLNLESFTDLVERLEQQLKGVMALYGGRRSLLSNNQLLVDFEGNDASDCAFRALCSAWLLTRLTTRNPGPKLRLGARVCLLPEAGTVSLAEEFMSQQEDAKSQQARICIAPELVDETLHQHLELAPDTGLLGDIKSPYKALLEKQEEQLQSLAG